MRITHFRHSALLVETGHDRILIDPGSYSSGLGDLMGLTGILLTHAHADHFDQDLVAHLLARNPASMAYLERSGLAELRDPLDSGRFIGVGPDESLTVGDTEVQTIGGTHAVIHPDLPDSGNVGYYFPDDGFLDPGDGLDDPHRSVRVLALPVSGPWQRISEAIDYLRLVNPTIAFPMHEGLLVDPPIYQDYVDRLRPYETQFRMLTPGTATEI